MKVQKTAPKHGPFHLMVSLLATLIVLGGLGLGIWFFVFFRNYEETNDAQVEQYVTPLITRVPGYIQELRFNDNQPVKKGDTLVVIDPREYLAQLDMAKAELEGAENHKKTIGQEALSTGSQVAIRRAELEAARVEVWRTEKEYNRYRALLAEDAATEQQVEQRKAAFESAIAHQSSLQHNIQTTALSTSAATSRLPTAGNTIEGKKAAVRNAALFVSYTVITAPYDGWVGRKNLQPGQLVKEGQALVTVVSREKWIVANFKETQIGHMKPGQTVEFRADATGNTRYHASIESFSPASGARFSLLPPDNATGNFVKIEQRIPVRIRLTDDSSRLSFLRAGMNVVVIAKHIN